MRSQRKPWEAAYHASATSHGQHRYFLFFHQEIFRTPQHAPFNRISRGIFRHFGYYTGQRFFTNHRDYSPTTVQQTTVDTSIYSENIIQISTTQSGAVKLLINPTTYSASVHFSHHPTQRPQVSSIFPDVADAIQFKFKISQAFSVFWFSSLSLQHLGCIHRSTIQHYHQHLGNLTSFRTLHQFSLSILPNTMAPSHSKLSPSTPNANRFAALMTDAKNPPTVVPTPPPVVSPPPQATVENTNPNGQDETEGGPWLMPPLKRNATNRKKGNQRTKPPVQLPKTIPIQGTGEKKVPEPHEVHKFTFDCRIKVQPGECVNPSRLLQAILIIFQKVQPKTALTTSMYDNKDCPIILDPLLTPITVL